MTGLSWASTVFLAVALPLRADDPTITKITTAPPDDLAPAVREVFAPEGVQFSADGKVVAEFWFRKELPTKEAASSGLGVSYGKLDVSTLVGAVRIAAPWSDYRKNTTQPGVYTLRYGVQPADGNHMGVSEYRDFLLLVPAAEDKDPSKSYALEDLVPLSFGASLTAHPAVLSLFPVTKDVTSPELLKNSHGQWMVVVKQGDITFGMVMIGHGEVEG